MPNNYNSALQSNNIDLQAILDTINELPNAGQATPVIAVSSNGLITATAGTKSSTHQLAFQASKTITPSTVDQIAVSSGYYTGGDITVAGDSNLISENIKSGVSIFGVNGTLEEGGGGSGDTSGEDSLVTGTATSYTNDRVTSIGAGVFAQISQLTSVTFPKVLSIGSSAFAHCSKLTTVSFPEATDISNQAFYGCRSLTAADFPKVATISNSAFRDCMSLTIANFPMATVISSGAFSNCTCLTTANFPKATKMIGVYAFAGCSKLTTVSFPEVTYIADSAFYRCTGLTTASFQNVATIGYYAFSSCYSLTAVSFPVAKAISLYAFYGCSRLATVSFPQAQTIGSYTFQGCFNLKSLYLTGSSVCTLQGSNAFTSTPIGGYSTSAGTYGSIYVPASLLTSYQTATNWTYFSSRFAPDVDFYFKPISLNHVLTNTTTNMSTTIIIADGASVPTFTISSDDNSIASISNIVNSDNNISFDITTYEVEGAATITIDATNGNHSQTATFVLSVWEEIPSATYTVEAIEGAIYGFELNDNDYYESKNKGKNSSYAICKVNIDAPISTTMYVDCINFAEGNYDYGLLSNLDAKLNLNAYADVTNVYHNFKGKQMASVQTVTYDIPAGEHFIYVKFIKDNGAAQNNDTLQFKIRFE